MPLLTTDKEIVVLAIPITSAPVPTPVPVTDCPITILVLLDTVIVFNDSGSYTG